MQTATVRQNNGQLNILKIAENPGDKKILLRIINNIKYIQKHYPHIPLYVLEYSEDQLIISGVPGVSFTSESAVDTYSHSDWILDSIIDILEDLQKKEDFNIPFATKIRVLFYPILRGSLSVSSVFPSVIRSLAKLLDSKVPWVDCHGDFTVYNLIVNDRLKRVSLVDWETFGVKPKYYDLFTLIFNQSIPVEEMTWQSALAQKYGAFSNRMELTSNWIHEVAIIVLFRYYYLEVYRQKNIHRDFIKSKYPGKDLDFFRVRAKVRLENLVNLIKFDNWDKLIKCWKWA